MENKDPKTKTDETPNRQKTPTANAEISEPKPHDAFFRWLFGDVGRLRHLLVLSGKVNRDIGEFISEVNLNTLVRIPDSYSEVAETGEADLAFRVEVASGAPPLVGILVEHKSGRDSGTLDQIARYVNSVMKIYSEHRAFSGLPTMAIIFYNGRENWNPLGSIEDRYPSCFRGRILPFACSFVNMIDIPDSDCLACEDTTTGMGIVAMKYAYDKENLLKVLPLFKKPLQRMPHDEAACLLAKISIYLKEYVTKDVLKELDMAFVSIGQKYGFVSAGDEFRKELAEARAEVQAKTQAEEQAKAQKQIANARSDEQAKAKADTATALREMGIPEDQIAEAQARIDALQKKRREQA